MMGAEDFSFMLEARPGAMILVGMGDGNECHHPAYVFNDNILGHGASLLGAPDRDDDAGG